MVELINHEQGVVVPVKARAGARRNAVTGTHAGELVVSVTQAPERGKANTAIVRQLAVLFGVRASDVVLLSGQTNPHKRFLIAGAESGEIRRRIAACVAG